MSDKPLLNLGCGRLIFPAPRPAHHGLVDPAIYAYPHWLNVDRNMQPGVDKVMDLFTYPWDLKDNAYSGALLSHLVEHIPHEIKVHEPKWDTIRHIEPQLFMRSFAVWRQCLYEWNQKYQDGWYAFWGELYRVLEPGALVHVLSPYGWSAGAITDPTHTRLITEHTLTHSMQPDTKSPFEYATGGMNFQLLGFSMNFMPMFGHLTPMPGDPPEWAARKAVLRDEALMTRINVACDIYAQLKVIK